MRTAHQVGL